MRLGRTWLPCALAACGAPEVAVDTPPPEAHVVQYVAQSTRPYVLVIVADDGRDASARELRGRIPAALRAGLLHERHERFGSCGETDPAAWHVGDVRIAVVRPSAPDDEAVVSWLDRPDLAWITTISSEAEIDDVVAAAAAALAGRPAAVGERYRPIRATERALDLLRRTRAPATPREQVLMATLPDFFEFTAVVLSTRDDEGDTPIPALLAGAPRPGDLSLVVGPFERVASGAGPAPVATVGWRRGLTLHLQGSAPGPATTPTHGGLLGSGSPATAAAVASPGRCSDRSTAPRHAP